MQSDEEKEALAPCPCCASKAKVSSEDPCFLTSVAYCLNCGLRTEKSHPDDCRHKWNTRASDLDLIRKVARDIGSIIRANGYFHSTEYESWIETYIAEKGWKK